MQTLKEKLMKAKNEIEELLKANEETSGKITLLDDKYVDMNSSYIIKKGKFVDICLQISNVEGVSKQWKDIGYINLRPTKNISEPLTISAPGAVENSYLHLGSFSIDTAGKIGLWSEYAIKNTDTLRIKATYITND